MPIWLHRRQAMREATLYDYRPRPTTVNDVARSAAASSCSPVGDVRESGAGFLGRRVLQGEALEFSQGGIDRGNQLSIIERLGEPCKRLGKRRTRLHPRIRHR